MLFSNGVASHMNSRELFIWHTHSVLISKRLGFSHNYCLKLHVAVRLKQLCNGDEFKSFTELRDKVSAVCVCSYNIRSRPIILVAK